LQEEIKEKEVKIGMLEKENIKMKNELEIMQLDFNSVSKDYKTLLKVMEKARKLISSDEDGKLDKMADGNAFVVNNREAKSLNLNNS